MRRLVLLALWIGAVFVFGCGQSEYDKRLEQNINDPQRMASGPAPVANEEDEEGADEEESGEQALESEDAAEDAAEDRSNDN